MRRGRGRKGCCWNCDKQAVEIITRPESYFGFSFDQEFSYCNSCHEEWQTERQMAKSFKMLVSFDKEKKR